MLQSRLGSHLLIGCALKTLSLVLHAHSDIEPVKALEQSHTVPPSSRLLRNATLQGALQTNPNLVRQKL